MIGVSNLPCWRNRGRDNERKRNYLRNYREIRRRPVRPIALNFYAHVDGGIKQQTSHSHRCRVYISQSRIRNLNEIWFLSSSTTEERRVLAKPRWRSTSGRAYPTVSLSIKMCAYFDSVQLYIVAEFPPGIRRTSLQCVLNAIDKT